MGTIRGRTPSRVLAALSGAVLLAGVCAAEPPQPGPPPAAAPAPKEDPAAAAAAAEKQARLRKQELLSRVNAWFGLRKDLVTVCASCNGRGIVRGGRDCSYCRAGRRISEDAFRKIYYEWKSPRWRALPTSKDEAETRYKAMRDGGDSVPPKAFRIEKDKAELVGECHAEVPVYEGDDTVPRPTRWVWAVEPSTKKETWFVYTETADGEFGRSCPNATVGGGAGTPRREPLPPLLLEETKAILEKAKPWHGAFVSAEREGGTLFLVLDYVPPLGEVHLHDQAVVDDSIQLTRALFAGQKEWSDVRYDFRVDWKDEFGRVEKKPRWTVSMTRERFDKIVWSELQPHEVFRLFASTLHSWPGWTLRYK
jgi:hypothetical protein